MIKKGLLFFCCMVVFVGAQAQSAQELADTYADLSYFKTPMALSMKKGFKKYHIEKIKNTQLRETARLLFAGQYDSAYRMAAYPAYMTPGTLGRTLMIGDGYSKYENMTGVYLPLGKQLVLVDRIAPDREVNLVIPNWNRRAPAGTDPDKDPAGWGIESQQFKLHNGVNIIDVEKFDGLAYIDYFSDTPESENPIQVHFAAASVNGYF